MTHDPAEILRTSTAPWDDFCIGYPGQGGYITALVLGHGTCSRSFGHAGSHVLDTTIAYDRAEVDDAYIGQINMIMVSSFCGPQGLIWGYDVAGGELPELGAVAREAGASLAGVRVVDGAPLRAASRRLFGTRAERRFPFLPGSHVPCAGKFRFVDGPTVSYAAVGIGVPEDRGSAAVLFMEDAGELTVGDGDGNGGIAGLRRMVQANLARSVVEVGRNQGVRYREVIVDMTHCEVPAGEVGCSLVAIPYFHIARNALTGIDGTSR